MRSRPAKIAVRVLIFVVVIVVILALPIWVGIGPGCAATGGVVALTRAGASGSNSLEAQIQPFANPRTGTKSSSTRGSHELELLGAGGTTAPVRDELFRGTRLAPTLEVRPGFMAQSAARAA